MEYEYENGTGPVDARSPFTQVSANTQRWPVSATKKGERDGWSIFRSGRKLNEVDEGTHNSPSKSRTMGGLQSSPAKPLPPNPPAFNALYNTPRKPRDEIDDSSAGETPRSPEPRDDSDATPDFVSQRTALTRLDAASDPTLAGAERERCSPTKERPVAQRRESLLSGVFHLVKNKVRSPGRGEVPRSAHAGAIEKKAVRRHKKETDRRVARKRRHSMSDSGDDRDEPPRSPRKTSGQAPDPNEKKPHWISSLFTFIGQHPTVPHILSFYAQLLFNLFLLCGCVYLIYCFWSAVQGDVDKKSHEATAEVMAEMAACAEYYTMNRCDRSTRLPALETVCENWAKCMKRDPERIGRAKVSAHTFAEIFNSFVEPISYKAMIFTFILVFGCFGISNFVRTTPNRARACADSVTNKAFGFFRSKTQEYQPAYGYGYGGPPPPTPQRSFSGQENAFYTPWHQQPLPGAGFEPQPSGGFGQIEGRGSPVKRLVYN